MTSFSVIDAGAIADVQDDVLLFGGLKTGRLGLNSVFAVCEARHDVLASRIADFVANLAGFVVGDGDLNAGNGGSGRVRNRSDVCCLLR